MTKREKEERKEVIRLYKKLRRATSKIFPTTREWLESLDSLDAPTKKGVYIILSPKNKVLHVGKTSADGGIREGLQYHLSGRSSFTHYYFYGNGEWLRRLCKFKCIEIPNRRIRAYLEVYTRVKLLKSGPSLP